MKPGGSVADRPSKSERDIISWLLVMPLLDRFELEALSGWSHAAVHRAISRLESGGRVASVRASVPGVPPTHRLILTGAGIEAAAASKDASVKTLLARFPVSEHWIRLLLARLTALTTIYRLVTALAETASIRGFRWYRKLPLDALIEIEGGRVLGVVREGSLAPPYHLGRRLRSLGRLPQPGALAILVTDELSLRDAQRLLERLPFTALIALEDQAKAAGPGSPVWYIPSDRNPWPLQRLLGLVRGGEIPAEPSLRRTPRPPARTAELLKHRGDGPKLRPGDDHVLPAVLDAGSKRILDLIALWPWISFRDLQRYLCVSKTRTRQLLADLGRLDLVAKARLGGRLRHVVSDRGLRYLARQDRLAQSVVTSRWSASPVDPDRPLSWENVRGSRARQLAKDIAHTAAIHSFTAALATQAANLEGELIDALPAHRTARRFAADGGHRAINPDAFYRFRVAHEDRWCFLEWERGSGSGAHFLRKLDPYVAYYSSRQAASDSGSSPVVLFVLGDEIAEGDFLRAAVSLTHAFGGDPFPVLASTEHLTKGLGPLGRVWRTALESGRRDLATILADG